MDVFAWDLEPWAILGARMSQRITFHGAARTVTGSRHLLEVGKRRILVDCGLFQGPSEIKQRNWTPFPIDPASLDAVILTHAHLDHIGYLPRLIDEGFEGPVYATPGTISLARISLPDSGRIQEEDARYANKKGYSRHVPALPLYTEKGAYVALKQLEPVHYHQWMEMPGGVTWRFLPAGHILGSAFAEIYFPNGERILMSGDLGRFDTPIIKDPTIVEHAEYLVVESTYGDRIHSKEDPKDRIESVFKTAWQTGGVVVVPSFSIGRTQEMLFYISQIQREGRLPRIPLFIDSPMATSTTAVYRAAGDEHDCEVKLLLSEGEDPMAPDHLEYVRDSSQSRALNSRPGPFVVIAGSGMASGGRVVHHLKYRLSNPTTIVLFTGYQVMGTLGRQLVDGAPQVKIHGETVDVHARVEKIGSLSAHPDSDEMLRWLSNFQTPPRRTFIVHGEPHAQEALRDRIVAELGWDCAIPEQGDTFDP